MFATRRDGAKAKATKVSLEAGLKNQASLKTSVILPGAFEFMQNFCVYAKSCHTLDIKIYCCCFYCRTYFVHFFFWGKVYPSGDAIIEDYCPFTVNTQVSSVLCANQMYANLFSKKAFWTWALDLKFDF